MNEGTRQGWLSYPATSSDPASMVALAPERTRPHTPQPVSRIKGRQKVLAAWASREMEDPHEGLAHLTIHRRSSPNVPRS